MTTRVTPVSPPHSRKGGLALRTLSIATDRASAAVSGLKTTRELVSPAMPSGAVSLTLAPASTSSRGVHVALLRREHECREAVIGPGHAGARNRSSQGS